MRLLLCFLAAMTAVAAPKVSSFRADFTPAMGEPLIWVDPTTVVEDKLWAKGIVLEDGGRRLVLLAVDWCGIGGEVHLKFRARIAKAAGTSVGFVSLHSVHQHTAPYIEGDGMALLRKLVKPPLLMSEKFLDELGRRLEESVKAAVAGLQPFDQIGVGKAKVERVASARRMRDADGKLVIRFSTGAKDPKMAALPEGEIDPELRTICFAKGSKVLARLHYYATHPQTFCCNGHVTADIVGDSREPLEKAEGIAQIYFTGAGGNVTVGKYNDGSAEARKGLAARLKKGMEDSIRSVKYSKVSGWKWTSLNMELPKRVSMAGGDGSTPKQILAKPEGRTGVDLYRAAINVAFNDRTRPLTAGLLEIGPVSIVHLPGEPFLEYQRFAQKQRPDRFVAVAGYGDISSGYVCIDEAYGQGGYEPSASNTGPGVEAVIKGTIAKLMGN